jgi:hypothetical protein
MDNRLRIGDGRAARFADRGGIAQAATPLAPQSALAIRGAAGVRQLFSALARRGDV